MRRTLLLLFLGAASLAAFLVLWNPEPPRPEPAAAPPSGSPTASPADPHPADRKERDPSPCTDPIYVDDVNRALFLVEMDPSVRPCIEVRPPATDAGKEIYARVLHYKALGLQERGETEKAIEVLRESLLHDPNPGTRVAVARALHAQGNLEAARWELAQAALQAMSDGAGAAALEDLFFTQVAVDRDLYLRDRDDASREQLCRSCDRFMELSWHHSFAEGSTEAVKAMAEEHCAGSP